MKDYSIGNQTVILKGYASSVRRRLEIYSKTDVVSRIWRKDVTIWVPDRTKAARTKELADRLGWLTIPEMMQKELKTLKGFTQEIRDGGYKNIVLLGMGGSSLAPEVFMSTFGNAPAYPPLIVLDSTHPDSVKEVKGKIDLGKTLFLVSSKSGTTLETISLFKFFYDAVENKGKEAGECFVAITDLGSPLEELARKLKFLHIFPSPSDVGGRYSALTYFGIVPAALMGIDLDKILKNAIEMAKVTQSSFAVTENPALILGAAIGELALAERNKITFFISKPIESFGGWIEQLVAESTGKNSKGILPVVDEGIADPDFYGSDRVFIYIRLEGTDNEFLDKGVDALDAAGHPIIRIDLKEKEDIGKEFFRWEMASAVAGAVLGINPFDQPDVEASKIKTKELMKEFEKTGILPSDKPIFTDKEIELYTNMQLKGKGFHDKLSSFLNETSPGGYVALMAYLPRTVEIDRLLKEIRSSLFRRLRLATTLGYGPRFLHSTGQLHKGDNNKGLFIQITGSIDLDLDVPKEPYSFGTLISAQAQGDYKTLLERKRRIVRCHLKGDLETGLKHLLQSLSFRTSA